MKTLKITILGLLMIATFGAAKANTVKHGGNDMVSANYTINTYVGAISRGRVKDMTDLLGDNLKYSIQRGNKVLVFNKSQYVESAKNDQNLQQDCLVTTTVAESTSDVMIVKVDMKYADVTRTNYVTLINSDNGWKITNIYSVFK